MNVRDLAIKFTAYAQYISAREWTRERSVLPMLLCVAPDIAQEKRMQRVAQAIVSNVSGLVVKSTSAVLLAENGPFAPIWVQSIPHIEHPIRSGSRRQPLFNILASVQF